MDEARLLQVPKEYRQLFRFFFLYRVIALIVALMWIIYKRAVDVDVTGVAVGWLMLAVYTGAI